MEMGISTWSMSDNYQLLHNISFSKIRFLHENPRRGSCGGRDFTSCFKMDSPDTKNAINLLSSTTLDLPPSCMEFVPWGSLSEAPSSDHFVVGTYNLEKEDKPEADAEEDETGSEGAHQTSTKATQSRNGSLSLFKVREGQV